AVRKSSSPTAVRARLVSARRLARADPEIHRPTTDSVGPNRRDGPRRWSQFAGILLDRTAPAGETKRVPERPTGTVTFLFTDIEGSTRLLQQLRDRYADVLWRNGEVLRAAFVDHDGHEIDTQGDAFFAVFGRARDAVAAAVAAQRAFAAEPWPDGTVV